MNDNTLGYDEDHLTQTLSLLELKARSLFAAACAERLAPAYERFHERTQLGNPQLLQDALQTLWFALETDNQADLPGARHEVELLLESLPLEHDDSVSELATMENATAAVLYAIDCAMTGNTQSAAWSARQAYEALDYFVSLLLTVDFNVPGSEKRVLSHPAVQAELHRQRRDLRELHRMSPPSLRARVSDIKKRAQEDGKELLAHMEGDA